MIKPTEEPHWRRSRRCATGACVEVAQTPDRFLVRDSKNLDATPITFTREQWTAFVAGVKAGDFGF
jgi:predicted secreted Zn-dependent protease